MRNKIISIAIALLIVLACWGISRIKTDNSLLGVGWTSPTGVLIKDEGTSQGRAGTLNFTGSGVTASVSGGTATMNITGGGGGGSGCVLEKVQNCNLAHDQVCDIYLPEFLSPTTTALSYDIHYFISGAGQTTNGAGGSGYTVRNENISNRSWVEDGVNSGHFSGAKDTKVVMGDWITIASTRYTITNITGNGTALNSVTLDGDPGASAAIDSIAGMGFETGGLSLVGYFAGTAPINVMYVGIQTNTTSLSATLKNLTGYKQSGIFGTTSNLTRFAFSQDDPGFTGNWKAYNGAAWVNCTVANFDTCGMLADVSNWPYYVLDSAGNPMTSAAWATFPSLDTSKGFKTAVGIIQTAANDHNYVQDNAQWVYDSWDSWGDVNFGPPAQFGFLVTNAILSTSSAGTYNLFRLTTNGQGNNTTYTTSTVFLTKCTQ